MKAFKVMMVILPLAFGATAQDTLATRKHLRLDFDIGFGCLCAIPMENVNRILFLNDLPSMPQAMFSSHVGVGLGFNKFSVAVLFKSYTTQRGSGNSSYGITGSGQGIETRVQYQILKSGDFHVAPYVGVGSQQFGFAFDNNLSRDLNSALQSTPIPTDSRHMNVGEFFLSGGVSVGISKLYSRIGYGFGLQMGYQHVTRGEWRLNDELLQTPSSSFSGLDIKLTLSVLIDTSPKSRK